MFHPLDIFKTDPDGQVLWLCAVEDFAAAKAHALITRMLTTACEPARLFANRQPRCYNHCHQG
jgi:hypothetical protein